MIARAVIGWLAGDEDDEGEPERENLEPVYGSK